MKNEEKSDIPAYRRHISAARTDQLYVRILDHILKNRLYRNSSYTSAQLARELGTNTRYVSATIANHTGGNYNALVNGFRLRDACRMLAGSRYSALTVEEIGLLAGFSSRQAFYQAFARAHKVTPREFRLEKLPWMRKTKKEITGKP